MRVAYRFPLVVGAALAFTLTACGSADDGAETSADAPREPEAVAAQEVPDAQPQQEEETTAAATPPGEPVDGGAGKSGAVTPTLTEEWIHVGESGSDACNLTGGQVTCYFSTYGIETSCPDPDTMVIASFAGGSVTTKCQSAGDAGMVPFANPGDVVSDPTGAFTCEVVDSPSIGLRCTDKNGASALLTAVDSRTL